MKRPPLEAAVDEINKLEALAELPDDAPEVLSGLARTTGLARLEIARTYAAISIAESLARIAELVEVEVEP